MSGAAEVVARLRARSQSLAVAESLTGGLVAELITSIPGASAVFRGGIVAYATDLKASLLGVDPGILAVRGAVAAETAAQMATGVAIRCEATWGLATTGVAGPDPQEGHPPGTVFIAVSDQREVTVEQLQLVGDRAEIRQQTAARLFALLLRVGQPDTPRSTAVGG